MIEDDLKLIEVGLEKYILKLRNDVMEMLEELEEKNIRLGMSHKRSFYNKGYGRLEKHIIFRLEKDIEALRREIAEKQELLEHSNIILGYIKESCLYLKRSGK